MKLARMLFRIMVFGLFILIIMSGCGGSGNDNDGSFGNPDTVTTDATSNAIDAIIKILFGSDPTTQQRNQTSGVVHTVQDREVTTKQQVSLTLACATSGSVTFNGTATRSGSNVSITGDIDFVNCDDIDALLTLTSTAIVGSGIDIVFMVNGIVNSMGCAVTFTQFSVDAMTTSGGVIIPPIIANGTVSATCGADSTTCILNHIDIENTQAFRNSCSP